MGTVLRDETLSSSSVAAPSKNDTPKDSSHMVTDEAGSDDEHHDGNIKETEALLQSPVLQRSLSCPYPVGSHHEGGSDINIMLI